MLAFAGFKIVTQDVFEIPPYISIGIIACIIGVSVWVSLRADGHAARGGGRAAEA